jgi:tetratricopeptide (TPR) repeat protein
MGQPERQVVASVRALPTTSRRPTATTANGVLNDEGSPMSIIDNFEAMLRRGQDSALLRYSLGAEYLKGDAVMEALPHLAEAVKLDPTYSAAWKLYGKALTAADRHDEAIAAFDRGIQVARDKGDIQAGKEMAVFRKRAERARDA